MKQSHKSVMLGIALTAFTGIFFIFTLALVEMTTYHSESPEALAVIMLLFAIATLIVSLKTLRALMNLGRSADLKVPATLENLDIMSSLTVLFLWGVTTASGIGIVGGLDTALAQGGPLRWQGLLLTLISSVVWFKTYPLIKGRAFFTGQQERDERLSVAIANRNMQKQKLKEFREQAAQRNIESATLEEKNSELLRVMKPIDLSPKLKPERNASTTIGIIAVGLGIAAVTMPYIAAVFFTPVAFICAILAVGQGDRTRGVIGLVLAAVGVFHIFNVSNQINTATENLQEELRTINENGAKAQRELERSLRDLK